MEKYIKVSNTVALKLSYDEFKELRALVNAIDHHEHYEGMNECVKCDESVLRGAIRLLKQAHNRE